MFFDDEQGTQMPPVGDDTATTEETHVDGGSEETAAPAVENPAE